MVVLLLLGFQQQFSRCRVYIGVLDDDLVRTKLRLQFGSQTVVLHVGVQEVYQPHTGSRMLVEIAGHGLEQECPVLHLGAPIPKSVSSPL